MITRKLMSGILIPAFLFIATCVFAADTTPPKGTVKINNNAAYTNTAAVTLNLSATDTGSGLSQMKFSNNNATWSTPEAYATTKSWTLASGDGTKTVYAKYKDIAGNWSGTCLDSIVLDTAAPTGTIRINNGAVTTTSLNVTLNLFASDTRSGISQMQFSNNNSTWSTPEAYATTKSWTLPSSGDGTKTVYAKYKDKAGNWSGAYSDTITFDTTPPTGTLNINNGAASINTRSVTLNLSAVDSGSGMGSGAQMRFSNDNVTWSAAQAYATTKSWTLTSGNGTKTVYVKYKDVAGNWSSAYSDTIILDTGIPTGSIKVNNGNQYTSSAFVILNLSATDTGSGLSQMKFSNNNSTWSAPEAYATTKSWTMLTGDGTKIVYVKYKDIAGNWSGTCLDSIVLDTAAPTGMVKINNGAATTASLNVTLNLSASDSRSGISQMQFSNNNATWSVAQAYAATKSWTLSQGNGTKYVYAKYKDNAGNWSAACSDSIILNAAAPNIVTTNLPDGIAQEEYGEYLNAIDGTPPYTWSIDSQNLPNGLVLNSATGAISGAPTTADTFSFVVKVTDANLMTDTQALFINILPAFPPITDEDLLDQTEARAALYFYNEALSNGFVKDADYKDFSSVSATGFGLASLCVMAERYQTTPNWTITPAQARARVNQILDNCMIYQNRQVPAGNNYGVAGFLYHFITADGTRQGTCEVSTVDMALFLAGAVTAGEYFGGEVKTKAAQIYNSMNWAYFLNTAKQQFSHGWFQDSGVMPATWDRPSDETMLVSLLAIGANPNNPDMLKTMYSWPRAVGEYGGINVVNSYFGSLFTYLFGHCFFDFEKLGMDNPAYIGSSNTPVNWWVNSVNAANANRQFCIDNATDYDSYVENSWGITICEYPSGQYSDFLGAAPCERDSGTPYHDGTIALYGAISSMPLMRTSSSETLNTNPAFKALKHYYQTYYHHLWGEYGPKDSFNHNREFSNAYLGIDVGPEVLMIENYRSGLLWNNFMKNAKVVTAAIKVFGDGFLSEPTTIYVDVANEGGIAQDGSAEHPFDTIQKAVDTGGSNVIINVAPGQYSGTTQILEKIKVTLKGIIGDRDNPLNESANTIIKNNTTMEIVGPAETSLTINGSINIIVDGVIITGDDDHYGFYGIPLGISASDNNGLVIRNTIIQRLGTGISVSNGNDVTISDNIVRQNFGPGWPGGAGGLQVDGGNVLITGNEIIGNHGWPHGGGIVTNGADALIQNNMICDNTASECGAGLLINSGHVEVTNNIITGNHTTGGYYPGQYGGGIYCGSDDAVIANNVIFENSSLHGSGIYIGAYRVALKGNIITVQSYNNGIESFADNSTSSCSLTYNDAYIDYGGLPPWYDNRYVNCTAGIGSISQDPLFVAPDTADGDPYNDDYHLQSGSPCINAGDPAAQYNDKDGTRNDMGVYGGPNALN